MEYAHSEATAKFGADPRSYCVLSQEFIGDDQGRVRGIRNGQCGLEPSHRQSAVLTSAWLRAIVGL